MKKTVILLFLIVLIVFQVLYMVILRVYGGDALYVPVILGCIVTTAGFFIVLLNRKSIMLDEKKVLKRINELYDAAERLLDISHLFLDNSYVAVKSSLKNNGNGYIDSDQAKLFLSELYKYNSIAKYIEEHKEKKTNMLKTIDEIGEKVREYRTLANNLSDMIMSLEAEIKSETFKRIDEIKNRYECNILANRLTVEYDCISEVIHELFESIIDNILTTSKPISEEILIIKKNVKLFIQNIEKWKENLTSETSDRNFSRVITKYNKQSKDFDLIYNNINEIYASLVRNLRKIIGMIEKISENSKNIQDIADRTNVLSINASIESSKAGEMGKGFRVISNEINKMSEDTKRYVKNIVNVIHDTKTIAQNVSHEFDQSSKHIIQMLYVENNEFDAFYRTLKDYHDDFNVIFNKVTTLIEEITYHVDKFNPIFQVHDISVQAMGNLNTIISQFLSNNKDDVDRIIECSREHDKNGIMRKLLEAMEKIITTDDEIKVINRIAEKYELMNKVIIKEKEKEIEFFK